jgi:type IV pilus assembly protein PilB
MSTSRKREDSSEAAGQSDRSEPAVKLPAVPASIGRETALDDAPVVAHLMRGESIRGLLRSFDGANNTLIIHPHKGADVILRLDNLRFLAFRAPLLPPEDAGGDAAGMHIDDTIELLFNDGRKFHVAAKGTLIESDGLHIFLDKADGRLYRLFIPQNVVKHYGFDASPGKGIVEQRVVGDQDVRESPGVAGDGDRSGAAPPDRSVIPPPATRSKELLESLARKLSLPSQHLGELLISQNIVNETQLYDAMAFQRLHPDVHLGDILVERGVATRDEVYSALAFKLGLTFVKLASFDIDLAALTYLPRELAVRFHMMPLLVRGDRLVVAMSDPTNSDACRMAEFIAKHRIEVAVASREDVDAAIDRHYRRLEDDEVIEQFEELGDPGKDLEEEVIREAERLSKEKSVVRLVQNMIIDAVDRKASDIHIRPDENGVEILLRIDGALIAERNINKTIHAAVVSRIKIIGRMDISERRVPQDGRASINLRGNKIDLRISVMPTVNGESVVIRILDTLVGLRNIDQLGFGPRDYRIFKDMISRSYGILLVTGPTGSGKSTTLYAALQHIRRENVNIITVEDPVEYHISGIEQMQVNHRIDYSFARILRNILRHDPDVIMVGEIRDQETAKTAIESALTGHLVLSTLHTNSAAVTITRLLEMGVDPYLINDTLLGVLAQRLVRVNCPKCIEEEPVSPSVYEALGLSGDEKFFHGRGCDDCNHTGYQGRMAVYELLQMNQEIRAEVLKGVSADVIQEKAVAGGMIPLTRNAVDAARRRKTSLAEVYRVRLE